VTDPVGDLTLRGFSRPVSVFSVRGLDAAQVST
jgi:class 3 adenylate cyclase